MTECSWGLHREGYHYTITLTLKLGFSSCVVEGTSAKKLQERRDSEAGRHGG